MLHSASKTSCWGWAYRPLIGLVSGIVPAAVAASWTRLSPSDPNLKVSSFRSPKSHNQRQRIALFALCWYYRLIGELCLCLEGPQVNVLPHVLSHRCHSGHFAIIAVFTLVDSLESNIKSKLRLLEYRCDLRRRKCRGAPRGQQTPQVVGILAEADPSYSNTSFSMPPCTATRQPSIFAVKRQCRSTAMETTTSVRLPCEQVSRMMKFMKSSVARGRYFTH